MTTQDVTNIVLLRNDITYEYHLPASGGGVSRGGSS